MGGRGLVALGVLAVVLVFVMPPIGLVLGVLTVVLATRLVRATRPQPQELLTPEGAPITVNVPQPGRTSAVFGLVLGITATALSALVLVALIAFWSEISDYTKCQQDTNTTQGENTCRTNLEDAIKDKLGQ